jgi:Ca-activated chloride channel family protein
MGGFLLLLLPAMAALHQESRQAGEFKISTEIDLVLLDVSVKNAKGNYVSGLNKENFRIYEGGALQPISEFASGDVPVAVGLVMDNSGSMRSKRPRLIDAGLAFIKASNPQDEIFIVNFSDEVRCGLPESVPFTDDVSLLRSALSRDRPQGRTALYDAITFALKHLESSRRGRKALVVVSDGGDNSSSCSLQQMMQLIQESPATIYTVGIYEPDDAERNPRVLKHIARLSGGDCFLPYDFEDVAAICTRIANDIRSRYTIGYKPVRTSDQAVLRKIRVEAIAMDGKKLNVRTRTSYVLPERVAAVTEKPEHTR